MLRLKSTGQEVFKLTWLGTSPQPWRKNQIRILVPRPEHACRTNKADCVTVHKDKVTDK